MLKDTFIAGFFCGEGYFYQQDTNKEKGYKGFCVGISMHKRDLSILEEIKNSLNCGVVSKKTSNGNTDIYIQYRISSVDEIKRIFAPRIGRYLLGYKKEQFIFFMRSLIEYEKKKASQRYLISIGLQP